MKQFEITKKNLEKAQATLTTTEAEFKEMKKVTKQLVYIQLVRLVTV